MKTQFSKIALAATLGLALAFTLSCSSDDGDKDGDGDKKRNIAGCLFAEGHCQQPDSWYSYTDEELNSATEKTCNKYEDSEYLPGGCPSNWKAKCVMVGIAHYYYDDRISTSPMAECTKK